MCAPSGEARSKGLGWSRNSSGKDGLVIDNDPEVLRSMLTKDSPERSGRKTIPVDWRGERLV